MPSVSYHCSPCSDLSIISVPNSWWSLSLGERVIWIFAYGQTLSSRLFIINTLSSYESPTDSCLHTSTMKLLWPRLRTTLWWFEQKCPHVLMCVSVCHHRLWHYYVFYSPFFPWSPPCHTSFLAPWPLQTLQIEHLHFRWISIWKFKTRWTYEQEHAVGVFLGPGYLT